MSSKSLEPTTRKGERQRERILEAAAGQFLADGYAAASVREIADAVGIGPSTLYHYFASKEDLLVAVHEEGLKRIQAALVDALAGVEEPWERLETACIAHLEALLEGGLIFRAVMREMPGVFDREALERIRVTRDNYERIFARLLDDLSLPRGTDRHELRLMLLGSLNWTFTWYRPGRSTPSELARTFVGFLKTQLQIDPPA